MLILGYDSYAELHYGTHYLFINIAQTLDALCPVVYFLKEPYLLYWGRVELKNEYGIFKGQDNTILNAHNILWNDGVVG